MPMIGIYHVLVIGEFHYQFGEQKMEKKKFCIGSVEELKSEMAKAVSAGVF